MSRLIARWQPASEEHSEDEEGVMRSKPATEPDDRPIELWRLTDEGATYELLRHLDWWSNPERPWEDIDNGRLVVFILCPTTSGLLRRKGMKGCYPLFISTRHPPSWLSKYNLYWPERRRWPGQTGFGQWTLTDRRMARRALWTIMHVIGMPPLDKTKLPYGFINALGLIPSRFAPEDGRGWTVALEPDEVFLDDKLSKLLSEPTMLIAPNIEFIRAYET